jgi:hypothetical protein
VRVPITPEESVYDPSERTINVYSSGMLWGSHLLMPIEMAIDLSKTKFPSGKPMFNVTVSTYKNNQKVLKSVSDTLHVIEYDYVDYTATPFPKLRGHIGELQNVILNETLNNKNSKHHQATRDGKFDICIVQMSYEELICDSFGMELVSLRLQLTPGFLQVTEDLPKDHSLIFVPFPFGFSLYEKYGWLGIPGRMLVFLGDIIMRVEMYPMIKDVSGFK